MKRLAALVSLAVLVAVAVVLVQQLEHDRQYRQLLTEGELALERGQSYQAIEFFSGALALRPTSMAAYYRRGEAYRDERQEDRAIRDLREAARLSPNASQPLAALGSLYDQMGDPAQAAEWYGQAADRLQDADPALLYSLALARYRAGAPAAAREPLRRALARDNSSAEGHYLLGLVYRDAQNIDEAIVSLEHAVRLAPALTPAREELADLYRERGRSDDEITQLQALAAQDDGVDRRIAIALAEARRERFDAAIDGVDGASAAAPNDSRLALATGRVLIMRAERFGDRRAATRAQAALERALGGSARRSEGLTLFGRALYLTGDIAGAERILQEALATSPIDAEAFAYLADAAEQGSHPRVARDALVDLDALQGDTVTANERTARARRIGALSLAAGDPRTAIPFLIQASSASPSDAGVLGMLARARWILGDAEGAKAALGQALALNSGDASLRTLSRTIK